MQKGQLPSSSNLYDACLASIRARGGEASNAEILQDVILELKISEDAQSIIHTGNRTELEYRLAWVRTAAKKKGVISSPQKGIWRLLN